MNAHWLRVLLVLAVFASALAVIQFKQRNRLLVNQMTQLRSKQDRLQVEWAQLQLEEATLAQHGRVEQFARTRLEMSDPGHYEIVPDKP